MSKLLDKDKILELEINSLMNKIKSIKDSNTEENDVIAELEKRITELERLKARVVEKKKLRGVYGDGKIKSINDSAAIPLGPSVPNAPFNADSIYYDVSPVIDPNLSEEEKKIEFLCCGEKLDDRIAYEISNNPITFKIHFLPKRDGGCRPGKKLVSDNVKIVAHETRTELGYAIPDRNREYYENLMDKNETENREVGYHFLCDADQIICFIPWDEVAFHASSRYYNYRSIGIERVVTEDAGTAAVYTQAKLIATLMYMNNIPINRVITHFDATNTRRFPLKDKNGNVIRDKNGEVMFISKSCPDRLLNGQYGGMHSFRQVIINCLRTGDLFINELENIRNAYAEMDKSGAKLGDDYYLTGGHAKK